MRRYSILFIVLGLISLSSATSWGQSREIGGQSLMLDDGHGHVVDITTPVMTGPGPYSWILPITSSGASLTLPSGTTTNSTLYWNGTNWLENPNLLAVIPGSYTGIGAASSSGTPTTIGVFGANGGQNGGGVAILGGQAGTPAFTGGAVGIQGGYGSVASGAGGLVILQGGSAETGNSAGGTATMQGGTSVGTTTGGWAYVVGGTGGSTSGSGGPVYIQGGQAGSAGGGGGSIVFQTTTNNAAQSTRMQITNAGTVGIGSTNQFTVDNSGNTNTTGTILANGFAVSGTGELGVTNSGIGGNIYGETIDVVGINGAAGFKEGLLINLSGSATANYGLTFGVVGGTSNIDITGTLNSWNVTSAGAISAASFTGAGTGLTGTATSLNIGGNAANVTGTVGPANGGTGVNNGTNTLTIGSGNITLTSSNPSSVTVPASGILATTSQLPGAGQVAFAWGTINAAGNLVNGSYGCASSTLSGTEYIITLNSTPGSHYIVMTSWAGGTGSSAQNINLNFHVPGDNLAAWTDGSPHIYIGDYNNDGSTNAHVLPSPVSFVMYTY